MRPSSETTSALKTSPQPSALHLGMNTALFQSKADALKLSHINKFLNKEGGDGPIGKALS